MDGVLSVDKPAGVTSHDVVDRVRRVFGQRKVGHAGTLDPMATGVLVVCLGKATRILEFLSKDVKEYLCGIAIGVSTDTEDAEGVVLEEADASALTLEDLERASAQFVGEIEQMPPMYSAVKHQGKRLYELARAGRVVERPARTVVVTEIVVESMVPGVVACADMLVRCGSGTYIRTLCVDIGKALGYPAHMASLRRTRVGPFTLDGALSLDELERCADHDLLEGSLVSIDEAISEMPAVAVDDAGARMIAHGMSVKAGAGAAVEGVPVKIVSGVGALLAIGSIDTAPDGAWIKPRKVLMSGD